jgi:FkbM family methyltransferase
MMLARILGLYEVYKHKAIRSLLRPGNNFIDIGVNKGDFSLLAAKIVGEAGRVLSFEPEPTNVKWTKKSINLNGYDNIQLFEIALSEENGTATLYLGKKSGLHTLVPNQRARNCGTIKVRTKTLDRFLEEKEFDFSIDMIKIDVEGSEMQVLRGARRVLSENDNVMLLIDIHPRLGVNPEGICNFLVGEGFSIFHEKPPFSVPVTKYSRHLTSIFARRI